MAKALAHPARIAIIDVLSKKDELCVCELTEALKLSQSIVSKHLAILKSAGIVDSRKEGLKVFYYIRTPCVVNFFKCMDQILLEDLQKRQKQLEKKGEDEYE